MNLLKRILYRLRGDYTTEQLIDMGMSVGKNFHKLHGVILGPGHCWLISIGDNVTIAPRAHILCHDASTKQFLGYTKIAPVTIGNNVFIGAESVILPGVTIGNNVIVGANSTVTHDIPSDTVYAGSPAKELCTLQAYLDKEKEKMKSVPVYDESWTLNGNISSDMKKKQMKETKDKGGFVI